MRAVFLVSILTISLISACAQFSEIGFSSGGVKGGFFSDEATKSSVSNENNSTDSDGDLIIDEFDYNPNSPLIGNIIGGGREFHSYRAVPHDWVDDYNNRIMCLNPNENAGIFRMFLMWDLEQECLLQWNINEGLIGEIASNAELDDYGRKSLTADIDYNGYQDIIWLYDWNGHDGGNPSDVGAVGIQFFDEAGFVEELNFPMPDTMYTPGGDGLQGAMIEAVISDLLGDGDLDITISVQYGGFWIIENIWSNDLDYDGYPNNLDAFQNDPNEWNDTDGDGIGDNSDMYPLIDNFLDSDGDRVLDIEDEFPNDPLMSGKDTDNDGIDDIVDSDIDGDGIPNSIENPSSELRVFSFLLVISLLVIISNDFKS